MSRLSDYRSAAKAAGTLNELKKLVVFSVLLVILFVTTDTAKIFESEKEPPPPPQITVTKTVPPVQKPVTPDYTEQPSATLPVPTSEVPTSVAPTTENTPEPVPTAPDSSTPPSSEPGLNFDWLIPGIGGEKESTPPSTNNR